MVWLVAMAWGAEGMWLPEQMPQLAGPLREAGVELPAAALADPEQAPLAAVVSLGFCSASFVSPDGLIATNHHCAEGWIARQSTGEVDHLTLGFAARDRASELPAGPDARVWIVSDIRDVSGTVLKAVSAAPSDAERVRARDRAISALVAKCEKPGGTRCRVASYWAGSQYRLITSREIRDVRIVFAPPASVGFFGGDLDNFEWPRHDGDFALVRAYVGPKGETAAYSPDNVPFKPKSWLVVDPTGAQPGEAVILAGNPGGTSRYDLLEQLRFANTVENPARLEWFSRIEPLLADHAARSEEARAHLASTIFGIENSRKYTEGVQDNLASSTVLADKAALAAKVDALLADPSRAAARAALESTRARIAADQKTFQRDSTVEELLGSDLYAIAHRAVRWADERAKKDADRDPGFQDRDREPSIARWKSLDAELWTPAEADYLTLTFERISALPADQRIPALDAWLAEQGGPKEAVKRLMANAPATDVSYRLGLLDKDARALAALPDPWIALALRLERAHFGPKRETDKANQGAWLREGPLVLSAYREALGGLAYPDANGTLRITYGQVKGYAPRDGLLAVPQTTLAGALAKHHTPDYEWPAEVVRAAEALAADRKGGPGARWVDPTLGDVPVAFLTDVDTTGGNSGSATLNGKGELIGLAYDGNYESMAADWQYDPRTTRSIHVDVRYLLWLLEIKPEAAWVLRELGQ